MARFADTNILLYSISREPAEARKRDAAIAILDHDDLVMSVQVLSEFYVRATRPKREDAIPHVTKGCPGKVTHRGTRFGLDIWAWASLRVEACRVCQLSYLRRCSV